MEPNRTYLIRILINNQLLTYTGKIKEIDDFFIIFTDKFGKEICANKNTIQSVEEVLNE